MRSRPADMARAREEQFGNEILVALIAAAHLGHGRHHVLIDNGHRVRARGNGLLGNSLEVLASPPEPPWSTWLNRACWSFPFFYGCRLILPVGSTAGRLRGKRGNPHPAFWRQYPSRSRKRWPAGTGREFQKDFAPGQCSRNPAATPRSQVFVLPFQGQGVADPVPVHKKKAEN